MPDWSLWALGALIFVVALCLSVVLHEAGHAIVAKLFKLQLREFFMGFGPRAKSFTKGGTEYGVRWIPLGGYVRIEDDRYPEKSYERIALARVHPMKRAAIFAAGPLVNLIIGSVLVFFAIMQIPYDRPSVNVGTVFTCTPAQAESGKYGCGASLAGIRPLDKVLKVDGVEVSNPEQIRSAIKGKDNVQIAVIGLSGDERTHDVKVVNGKIGLQFMSEPSQRKVGEAFEFVGMTFDKTFESVEKIPETAPSVVTSIATGERDEKAPGSVVSAGKTYGEVTVAKDKVETKAVNYLLLTGLFNLGLGIVNLLPLLPLDGGRVLVGFIDYFRMGIAKLQKKEYAPIGEKAFKTTSIISAVIVLGFMSLLILSDFSLLFRGNL